MKHLIFCLLSLLLLQLGCSSVGDNSNSGFRAPDAGDTTAFRDLPPSADAPAEPASDTDVGGGDTDPVSDTGDATTDPTTDPVNDDPGSVVDVTDSGLSDTDPCAGLTPCSAAEAGSRCESETVVICEQSYDGCWFETRQDCAPMELECVESGSNASCSTPQVGGDTCTDAIALTAGSHSFDTTGYINAHEDYTGPCDGEPGWAPEIVFSVDVPAGLSMRATIYPEDSFDAVALISSTCPGLEGSCLISADEGFSGDSEVVSVRNTGGATTTVYVIVEGWGISSVGAFSMTIEIF